MKKIRVGVYVKDIEFLAESVRFVDKLINNNKEQIVNIKNKCDGRQIITDITIYDIVVASEYARGYKFNIIYYQCEIDNELCKFVIEPSLIPYTPYIPMGDCFVLKNPVREINLGVV